MTGSRTGPFSLIRELLDYTENVISIYREEGILQITLDGFAIVTSKFLEGMKRSGFVLENIRNSIDPEFLSKDLEGPLKMECVHDVPIFVWTIIRFKDTELPPIEDDDGKCDSKIFAIDEQARNSNEGEINSPFQEGVNK